ncbi:MAG: hypothetical protein M3142_07690 [Bacteroidota bacterium]|nr:hypothetical protein [Bacteroidota bacterium]
MQEAGTLFVQLEGNPNEELIPDTEDIFFTAEAGVQLQFFTKKAGIQEIEITASTQKFSAQKIE